MSAVAALPIRSTRKSDIPTTLKVTRIKQIVLHLLVRVVRTLDMRTVPSSCAFPGSRPNKK
jgi:hypothetical protein